ncbi:unnamed protein product [Prorocentrum cordatum]|uniref:Uncharacterized protein n=1 Tax=Prorocentrum cordatum TaxID=2364126 RepID=A0ABN9W0B5_9DINO|nr:unnamed protein product [Polarella glacialis]
MVAVSAFGRRVPRGGGHGRLAEGRRALRAGGPLPQLRRRAARRARDHGAPRAGAAGAGGRRAGDRLPRRGAQVYGARDLRHYDVAVCVDGGAAESLRGELARAGEDPYPPSIVELADFGAYLEMRRPESPMKAWVPDLEEP